MIHQRNRLASTSRLLTLGIALALVLGCTAACKSAPKRVEWENRLCLSTRDADFFAEPGIELRDCRKVHAKFRGIVLRLIGQFFPAYDPEKRRLSVVLYRDHASYNRHRVVPIKSLADYNRLSHTIHIAIDAPAFVWRHEITHALLEALRPGTPYWLHEGLALLVQNQNLPRVIRCDGQTLASMPAELKHFIAELRSRPVLIPGNQGTFQLNEQQAGMSLGLSGYFVLYIWDRRQLQKMLRIYQTTEQNPQFILTGDDPELRAFLHEDFIRWIRTPQPTRKLPGC